MVEVQSEIEKNLKGCDDRFLSFIKRLITEEQMRRLKKEVKLTGKQKK